MTPAFRQRGGARGESVAPGGNGGIALEPALAKSPFLGGSIRTRDLSQFLVCAAKEIGLNGEVSVLLTGDGRIRELNREFRGVDQATDVLSFPASPPFAANGQAGDLAISLNMASRQAAERGHTLQMEVKTLMLHGLLHLAGLDHETDSGEMARRERRLRMKLALPLGLIERQSRASRREARSGRSVSATNPRLPKKGPKS